MALATKRFQQFGKTCRLVITFVPPRPQWLAKSAPCCFPSHQSVEKERAPACSIGHARTPLAPGIHLSSDLRHAGSARIVKLKRPSCYAQLRVWRDDAGESWVTQNGAQVQELPTPFPIPMRFEWDLAKSHEHFDSARRHSADASASAALARLRCSSHSYANRSLRFCRIAHRCQSGSYQNCAPDLPSLSPFVWGRLLLVCIPSGRL